MKDQLSALMDAEIDTEDAPHLFTALKSDVKLQAAWSEYHLIGDVMRGSDSLNADFTSKLMAKLEAEPTVLAPHAMKKAFKPSVAFSVAASAAAVFFVGWMVLQQQLHSTNDGLPAQSIAANTMTPESIDGYMQAHQEVSGSNNIQTSGFIQQANYSENAAR